MRPQASLSSLTTLGKQRQYNYYDWSQNQLQWGSQLIPMLPDDDETLVMFERLKNIGKWNTSRFGEFQCSAQGATTYNGSNICIFGFNLERIGASQSGFASHTQTTIDGVSTSSDAANLILRLQLNSPAPETVQIDIFTQYSGLVRISPNGEVYVIH
jgi:hypothetical protein